MIFPANTLHRSSKRQFESMTVDIPTAHEIERGLQRERNRRIRELREEGYTIHQIELAVFGYSGGSAYKRVVAALEN